MKKRETYDARLVDGPGDDTHEAKLVTGSEESKPVNPYETPKGDIETDRHDERMQAAAELARRFWEIHASRTNPEAMKRDYFFAHLVDYGALAVATDEQKEEAYQHFEDQLLPMSTFDYRGEKK